MAPPASRSAPQQSPPGGAPAEPRGGLSLPSLSTTPGRLRAERSAVIAVCLATALLAFLVVNRLDVEANRIADEAQPAIVRARQIQTSLAEANAAAATSFLIGEVDGADRNRFETEKRQAYLAALDQAATDLEATARLISDDAEAHTALATINAGLARYSGLIETARANNRQGYPVGSAYLDEATLLLENEIYPLTDLVANRAAADYRGSYDANLGLLRILGLVSLALVVFLAAVLVAVQLRLQRRFKRLINPPLALATVTAVVVAGWLAFGVLSHTSQITEARTEGYQGIRLVLDLRGTAFGARADEARFLIARGAGASFEADYQRRGVVIDEVQADIDRLVGQTEPGVGSLSPEADAWLTYDVIHDQVAAAGTDRQEAVNLALGEGDQAFQAFASATETRLTAFQSRFDESMDGAGRALTGMWIGVPVLLLLTAGLAAYGLQLRINEYR
jgi:hypothetical protein